MEHKSIDNRIQTILAMACGSCITVLILLIMNKDYPFVGHDYRYFIPRLLDTDLHIQLNGLSIQWYTPSFGGGLPAFPNPQHIEYSIVQWLTIVFEPWLAILLSTAGISLVGYYFFFKFLNEKLELNWMASTVAAMFFIGNGFYIEHLITGMMGYQLFPLGAVLLYALTDQRNSYFYNSAIAAIVITLMVHQAGFYLIIIFILSFSMVLPILFLYKPLAINVRRITLIIVIAVIFSAGMTASKVYATYSFMHHFPRLVSDNYDVGLFQALIGIVAQLFGVMTFVPVLITLQHNPEFISGALSKMTGTEYGIWETDIGLSPVLIIFLLFGLARTFSHLQKNIKLNLNHFTLFRFLLVAVPIWATIEMILAKGIIYATTKQLPILKSLHTNLRYTSAFMLPVIIVGAFELHSFFLKNPKQLYFFVSALLTSISLLSFFSLSNRVYESDFSVDASNALHEKIRRGITFPVLDIIDTPIAGWYGFSEHASLYKPYEPIFGYQLETFSPEINPGTILQMSEGYFNMTNPASLVFPEINNLHPFERIKVSEEDKLRIFLERGQPEWNIPLAQKLLNIVSLITAISSITVPITSKIAANRIAMRNRKTMDQPAQS